MKKLLLLIVVLVLLAAGANWYYTRQIRDQLDRVANMASMFGTLSYEDVRLSPFGAVNINNLSFRVHQGRGGIDIEQISLQTANLLALITLQGKLEQGQLPETLGVQIKGIQFPLDGAVATMARQTPGNAPAAGGSGVLFNAAGCDGRTQFTAQDLMQMDYFDIHADVEARYRLDDNGDRLRLFVSTRNHGAGTIDLEATLDLLSDSMSTRDLARSMQDARLRAFSLWYEDLGFYERMLAFCADEMSMTESDYIAHHLEAWKRAWSQSGVEPGPDTLAAYEAFLEDPQQLSVNSDSEQLVSIDGIQRYTIPAFLERMNAQLVVNYGEPQPLDMIALDGSSGPAAPPEQPTISEQPAAAEEASAPTESTNAQAASPEILTETDAEADADTDEPDDTEPATTRRWAEVDLANIEGYLDDRVRIRMRSGDRYAGRLSRVDSEHIHIRVQGVGGFHIRPLAREEIREVTVYDGP